MSDFDYSQLPRTIDIPDKPVPALLLDAVAAWPDQTAIAFHGVKHLPGVSLTYREFDRQVQKVMNVLKDLGVERGEPVGLMSPNCPQALIVYHAVLRYGAIVTQANPLYVTREVEHQFKDAGVRVAFVLNLLLPVVEPVFATTSLEKVVVIKLTDYIKWPLTFLFNLAIKKQGKHVPDNYDERHLSWTALLEAAGDTAAGPAISPDDIALYQYTGGTTGAAKGVILTHRNIYQNARQGRAWFTGAVEGQETFILALPIFHAFGMTVGMNLAMAIGARMVIVPKFEAEVVMKLIAKYGATLFPGVPAMYNAINSHEKANHVDISSIKYCISGAAGLPLETKQRFESLTGGKLVEGYGLTEASPTTHCNPLEAGGKTGSIGMALPNTESKIVVGEDAHEAKVGEIGELIIRGPQVMQGYRNRPEETAQSLRNGWLFTGDMGYVDDDGFVFLMDRKKEMIITGGYNVYPKEVEDELRKLAGVAEVAALGLPDDYLGEKVTVAIVLEEGATLTSDDVVAHCKKQLAGYKVPKQVHFVKELPKTIIGKVLKRILKEKLQEGV